MKPKNIVKEINTCMFYQASRVIKSATQTIELVEKSKSRRDNLYNPRYVYNQLLVY
jgi:hypothetical protein